MPWGNTDSFNFTDASIRANAPQSSGVYALYTAQRWVYIGESQTIRDRLLQHFSEANTCIKRQGASAFSYEFWPAAERVERQNALIRELIPACNQMLG